MNFGYLLGGGGILNEYPGEKVTYVSTLQEAIDRNIGGRVVIRPSIRELLHGKDEESPNKTSCETKQIHKKKPRKRRKPKSKDDTPSKKVKMKIFLERFDTGIFVTKVKVEHRSQWQKVRYEKQALRFHPALKMFQKVISADKTMKNHKTLDVSLSKDELLRYKAGDLLEGVDKSNPKRRADKVHQQVSKPSSKRKSGVVHQQVNNYYHINNYYNAGPSTSKRSNEANYNEYSNSESINYHFSDSSTD